MENVKSQCNTLETEYIRNMNCNYARLRLEEKPRESRYQYCILNRGGIRFLLPCSLRYIDGEAFLYYDISSTQNIVQLFEGKAVGREWMRAFLWGMERMGQELYRFLLEDQNVIWSPLHIYQDLEKNDFFFMYVPYCQKDRGFKELLDFWVEHIDYEDEALVEFVYNLYEQYATAGDSCINPSIYERFREAEKKEKTRQESVCRERKTDVMQTQELSQVSEPEHNRPMVPETGAMDRPRRFLSFLGGRRRRQEPVTYQEILQRQVVMQNLGAVGEEVVYGKGDDDPSEEERNEEEYGKTVYLEESEKEPSRGLYREDGELAVRIDKFPFVIGKKREEADLVLEDRSVSRIHARILDEEGSIYLEDLNSTNGTFKNGLRMRPYEKRRLEKEDELRFGKVEYIFR